MADPIILGTDAFIKRYSLPQWDEARGDYVTEEWSGPYDLLSAKVTELKSAGARDIRTSKAGYVCTITCSFGGLNGSNGGGGGGGGPSGALSTVWEASPQTVEFDLARLRTWGTSESLDAFTNIARAKDLEMADKLISEGRGSEILDSVTASAAIKAYARLKMAGYRGYMRAHYTVSKTTTWAGKTELDSAISYADVWKVVAWAAVPGKPAGMVEPQYRDVTTAGAFATASMKWLTMPPGIRLQGRTWTLSESWMGALEWRSGLYEVT